MPAMVVLGRRWRIASDDLVFPGAFELFIRALWWIGTLVLYTNHKGRFDCQGGAVLHNYLVVLLVLLAIIILTLCAIVYISAQGTIMNPGPRRSMPALVYLRAVLYIPEFVWACLGAVWVSDSSTGCKPAEVGAVIAAVISSWVILLSMVVGVLIVFDPLGSQKPAALDRHSGLRNLESSESSQLFYRARTLAARVWESRLRLLCCCLPQDDNHRAAFSSISQLVSGFFLDTDLVPSDIAAGLALLHQEQDKMEHCRDPDEVLIHSPSSPIREDLEVELEKSAHFLQFAVAAYGWPLYIYSNPLTGLCKLSGGCCGNRHAEYDLVGGDNLGCHFTSILQSTGLQYRDFIHISFHNQIYEIPFFVALDHKRESVLVAVRGTLSLKDVLTDLSAECENFTVEGVSGTCYAHKGISQAANYIYKKLVNDGILSQAFNIAPEYKLVITGHSLGAGTASLLAVLLRSTHPTLECYAFSPPGGLLSKALADYSKQFIISVVLGKDLVPRLSIPNMEDLKRRILKMVSNCSKPKYKILMHGCWYEVFGGTPDDFPTEMENRREEALNQPLLGEESLLVQRSSTYQSLSSDDSPTHPTHLPLYLPGRIMHVTEEGPTRRHCFSQVRYRAEWSSETAFRNVLISPRMIADHMPDVVLRALRSLTRDHPFALCHSSMSNSHLNVI
ncbi:diacylglycerol lipase-beta [Triplophysa rosa]|uniref:Diacylglycerol lipase-beta n=1 Tax=Triplophysa rosa TaxID=992332 RepID=A0A9W7WF48_TRIRA|nr:diacylglycerol lipase-beta [Triplophysa rosa]KAI7796875.1 putative sn1-specific diacylglycerol lipase beta [Triplophysa rosa]